MEEIRGFARTMARMRVGQHLTKPFMGKAYVKYGQCLGILGYCFQLGGVLGAKHRDNLDAFGHAFLGATGHPGAVERFFTGMANDVVGKSIDSMNFGDYVTAEFSRRLGFTGDPAAFLLKHGMNKLLQEQAEELAWEYAGEGAALGTIYPRQLREMFDRQHAAVPREQWDFARAAGLDIPVDQDVMSYEETEEGENGVFMAYCQQCCPELYAVLAG
jgi:hypothetical protein